MGKSTYFLILWLAISGTGPANKDQI